MIEIPKQLQHADFRFILLEKNSKKPIEKDWVNTNNYAFNDKKLLEHLKKNGNYGVVLGYGNLFALDIDVKNAKPHDFEKFKSLDTFQVLTGGGGLHLYFRCDKDLDLENETLAIGELKAKGVQVVGPNCLYTNGLTKYKVEKDLEIFTIKKEKIKKFYEDVISAYKIRKETTNDLQTGVGAVTSDTSRSGLDFNNLRLLIQSGKSKEEIFEQMVQSSVRWKTLNTSKKDWEYENARKSLEKYPTKNQSRMSWKERQLYNALGVIEKEEILPERRLYSAEDLMKKELAEPEYFLRKLIPKGKTIVIGAKAGRFKTGFILNAILSMSNVQLETRQLKINEVQQKIPQEFLGKFKVENLPRILYYDLDMNGEKSLRRKIQYFLNGMKYNPEILKRIDFEETFYKNDLKKELEIIKDYDIIVLDSYRRFLKGDENDTKITNEFFENFLKKAKQMGKTVIVLHHFKKEKLEDVEDIDWIDAFRGSSDIVAQFDVCYAMTKTSDKEDVENKKMTFDVFIITPKDREDLVTKKFSFRVLKNDNDFTTKLEFLGYEKPAELYDLKEKEILTYLQGKDWTSRQEILRIIKQKLKCSIPTIDRTLKDLTELGEIESNSGLYRRIISDNIDKHNNTNK